MRQAGVTSASQARKLWEMRRWKLPEIDRLRRASGAALVAELHDRLGDLFARSYKRRAALFASEELEDPRALRAAQQALAGLHALAVADPGLELGHERVRERLDRIEVQLGEGARPDRVQVAAPEAIRARRFEAVFVCGLQEAEFPRPSPRSRSSPTTTAARSPRPAGSCSPRAATRSTASATSSTRAHRAPSASWRCCRVRRRGGRPAGAVVPARGGARPVHRPRHGAQSLSEVTWPLDAAPTEAEWERAFALEAGGGDPGRPDGLHDPAVLEELAGLTAFSASALEAFADCPVKWLVERFLHPEALEPDPEPLVRGSYAHAVLEATYSRLRDRTGSAKVTPDSLAVAEEILLDTMREKQPEFRISPKETRFRTAVRRLEFDLLRHLRREAGRGGVFEPAELELGFGMPAATCRRSRSATA